MANDAVPEDVMEAGRSAFLTSTAVDAAIRAAVMADRATRQSVSASPVAPETVKEALRDMIGAYVVGLRSIRGKLLDQAVDVAAILVPSDAATVEADGPRIKPAIITALREWAEFEQDGGNVEQGAAIDMILDWYDRWIAAAQAKEGKDG